MTNPEYSVFKLDLRSAGNTVIDGSFGLFRFLRAEDASGVAQPDALVEVAVLATATESFFPFTMQDVIKASPGTIRRIKLRWAAHASVRWAYFVASYSKDHLEVEGRPVAQLTVGDLANSFTWDGAVTVGTSAVQVLTSNSNRRRALIYAGSADLYISPTSTVVTTGVVPIPAGSFAEVLHTGDLYARRAAGSVNAGVIEELRA